ncbi:MAG TPA: tetratricopeptide repeat protein [Candidatus Limnocylindria bacterium]|nr:tetratricopeptide repeat protein [Candidatus Limnocylindria bacterium]
MRGLRVRARRVGPSLALLAMLCGCARLVLLHDPLSAAEHNDLGVAYERAGKIALAEREYRKALRLESSFARARVNLGNLAAAAGRWPEAERHYRRALRDLPGDPDARNNLAVTLLRRGRAGEETEWLARSAVALVPADSAYRRTLSEVLEARTRP